MKRAKADTLFVIAKPARRVTGLILLLAAGLCADPGRAAPTPKSAATPETPKPAQMKVLAKEVFIRRRDGRPPVTGFVSYVSKTKPVLMHCYGWEDFSDGYDDYTISLSHDNGKTWSAGEVRWKSETVPEGRIRYAEPAVYFDSDKGKLIVLMDKVFYPQDKLNVEGEGGLVLDVYDAQQGKWSERRELKFSGQRPVEMSFGYGIKTARGRLLFPGQRRQLDANGKVLHHGKNKWPVEEAVTVIGEYGKNGELAWRLGQPLNIAPELSARGICECIYTELADGRIAAVCRGSNQGLAKKPGFKWLSFSENDGETWSAPAPLPATGGDPIESSATGSALFRSSKNGKLYWMGNLALGGEQANGNWPRSPLVIAEVQEKPFALKRDTIFKVDERSGTDSARLQLSNFRFYQDRETGDLVIFLTRYSAESETDWKASDYYRYRVQMP